ncbi:hypothetical protein [Pseudomonas sp. UBA6323]|uniref:hypothetical protein n=1 Tax=Pseudomonas sp. UBA6323 TaxID=1947329 RepID=UPI0025E6BE4F|nr:hypothetical protein [Pseudomonas sp. UBA6323]
MEEIAPFKYITNIVPKPHSAFERYIVQITPNAGLSWVKSLGHTISTNRFGLTLLTAFNSMEEKLSAAYGGKIRTDFLMDGSIWNEPQDWMQALQLRERFLGVTWDNSTGANLKDSLSSIYLGATAVDTECGFIFIEYSFENSSQAEAEIAASEDDAL